ncbi:MAG TPA: rod shape-determining protein MreD [Desulfobaccales bacterium]
MIAAFLSYSFLGLALFYLQNLVFFPHVHLRFLALLLFYVSLRPSLGLALALALTLGTLQDSFATTPFGMHLGAALLLVATARFFRQRLLWQRLGSQVVASLVALILQEVFMQVSTMILGYEGFMVTDLLRHHGVEILGTAALGPLMYLIVQGLENFLRRFGWRPGSAPSTYQPFSGT